MKETSASNIAELCGVLAEAPHFSHSSRDELYYVFALEMERLSGTKDVINVVARKSLLSRLTIDGGEKIHVMGELRSFNNRSGQGNKLVISVFAKSLAFSSGEDINSVYLNGTICKPPNFRKTPMGREICDVMLAVGRRYGRSDYLPCIFWGQDAADAATLDVGSHIAVHGRIQSRKYIKMQEGCQIEKTAYELSVMEAEYIDDPVDSSL